VYFTGFFVEFGKMSIELCGQHLFDITCVSMRAAVQ